MLGVLHAPVAVLQRLSLDGQLQVPFPHALRHHLQLQLQVAPVLLASEGRIRGRLGTRRYYSLGSGGAGHYKPQVTAL